VHAAKRVIWIGDSPFVGGNESQGRRNAKRSACRGARDDPNLKLKTITEAENRELATVFRRSGGLPRWNGSLYYPTKMPDLIGIKDRRYFDHAATHLHSGIGDLMRYAALVSFAESVDFGPHHVLSPGSTRVQARLSDEAFYALARYIYSLGPPPNPNPRDDKAVAGSASSNLGNSLIVLRTCGAVPFGASVSAAGRPT
jgi:hypothetical protein